MIMEGAKPATTQSVIYDVMKDAKNPLFKKTLPIIKNSFKK